LRGLPSRSAVEVETELHQSAATLLVATATIKVSVVNSDEAPPVRSISGAFAAPVPQGDTVAQNAVSAGASPSNRFLSH
jgi:hypothetical protein